MQNRVTVTIRGQQYTLLAPEGQEYVQRVAAYVDEKLAQTASAGNMALVDCAVLTALNIADERFKEQEAARTSAVRSRICWRSRPSRNWS